MITEEQVEAAARAMHDWDACGRWEIQSPERLRLWRARARHALEAAEMIKKKGDSA